MWIYCYYYFLCVATYTAEYFVKFDLIFFKGIFFRSVKRLLNIMNLGKRGASTYITQYIESDYEKVISY